MALPGLGEQGGREGEGGGAPTVQARQGPRTLGAVHGNAESDAEVSGLSPCCTGWMECDCGTHGIMTLSCVRWLHEVFWLSQLSLLRSFKDVEQL